ncbi:uncharacterized protein [Primulina huaijiensis]|uniref:uncharacterized protein n=1 Tax=Primulina huaijiensis TaxID=1492673 RepID=UPI003CC70B2A
MGKSDHALHLISLYSVLINDRVVGPIQPHRGLRQGCPLSPYFFILCAHGLSSLILDAERRGAIHGCCVSRGGPTISHLLFADDSPLFCKAKEEECGILKQLLRDYEEASGQSINFAKSGIMFSSNLAREEQQTLSDIFGITKDIRSGKYLGLSSLIGKNKKEIFSYIKDRLWKRIHSWRGKYLSKAGREVLIKAVAQALPSYCMNVFLLPNSTTDELQRIMNSFWWGSQPDGNRGIKWLSWERLCTRKIHGGMSFRNLESFNLAMLGKQAWNLISKPMSLMAKVLKAKYFPNSSFLEASLGHNPSFIWRSLWNSKFIMNKGIRLRVGDDHNIRVWKDPWLRDPHNFYIESPLAMDIESMTVKDLINQQWDIGLLQGLFCNRDVREILNIPLHTGTEEDKCIWHHGNNGKYSVCSGYKIAQEILVVGEEHKIQEGFVQWLFQILSKAPESAVDKIAMVLWGIWRARNEKLWNRISNTAHQVVDSAMMFLSDWKGVRGIERSNETSRQPSNQSYTWEKPQAPTFKCNVDATLQNERRTTGLEMVLRDFTSSFISARTNALPGLVGIKEAEAMASKEALSWVDEDMGLQEVIFESDSKVVINAINSQSEDDSEFGILISACRVILRQLPSYKICFTRRQANKITHNLARVSCFHARPMI